MTQSDDKYVVFRREDLFQMLGQFLPRGNEDCAPVAEDMVKAVEATLLPDAVVIRRQDFFAAPALHTYANSIGLAARLAHAAPEQKVAKRLQSIADYFHEQAVLADEEGFKIPD